jgi:hypothetical protein
MPSDDSDEAENVWRAQNEGKQPMNIGYEPDRIASLARSREKLNVLVRWGGITVTGALALGFLYKVWSTDQPWIRFGQAWAFGWLAFMVGTESGHSAGRKGVYEPCIRFLELQHEERAKGYLRLRVRLWLLVPSIVASWLGGGPLMAARARGLDPSSWLFHFCAGPWPFIIAVLVLALVWLAFGGAARKAKRDVEDLHRGATG